MLAEEVISTVWMVQAFGSQMALGTFFDEKMNTICLVDGKVVIVNRCSFGVFYFVIYTSYALSTS